MEMMDVGSSIGKNVGPLFPTNTNPGDLHEFSSHFGPVEFAKRTNLFGGGSSITKAPGSSFTTSEAVHQQITDEQCH